MDPICGFYAVTHAKRAFLRVLESPDSSSQNKPSYETALRLFSKEIHKLTDSIDNATFLSSALLKQSTISIAPRISRKS